MQVERDLASANESGARVSNAWVICPLVGDTVPKGALIPNKSLDPAGTSGKGLWPLKDEPAYH